MVLNFIIYTCIFPSPPPLLLLLTLFLFLGMMLMPKEPRIYILPTVKYWRQKQNAQFQLKRPRLAALLMLRCCSMQPSHRSGYTMFLRRRKDLYTKDKLFKHSTKLVWMEPRVCRYSYFSYRIINGFPWI